MAHIDAEPGGGVALSLYTSRGDRADAPPWGRVDLSRYRTATVGGRSSEVERVWLGFGVPRNPVTELRIVRVRSWITGDNTGLPQ